MKIAIIGYKNHASRIISIINQLGVCNELIVFYTDRAKLAASFSSKGLKFKVKLTSSLQELNQSACIFIVSPTSTHFYYLNKLLPLFKGYIFCEKPPCSSIKELNKLYLLSNKDKERIYFNFNYRFTSFAKFCKKSIENGKYGTPLSLRFSNCHGLSFMPSFKDNWRNRSNDILENIIGNVGVHYVDLVCYLFGGVIDASVSARRVSNNTRYLDTAFITINTKVVLPVTILISYAAPFQNNGEMIFSDAIIKLDDGVVSMRSPRDTFNKHGMFSSPNERVLTASNGSREYYDESIVGSIMFFLDVVINNKIITAHHFTQSLYSVNIMFKESFLNTQVNGQ